MLFGEFLVSKRVLSKGSIEQALVVQGNYISAIDRRYRRIGNILLLTCAIEEEHLVPYLAEFLGEGNSYTSTSRYQTNVGNARILSLKLQEETECVILAVNEEKRKILVGTIASSEHTITKARMEISKKRPGYTIDVKKIMEVPFKLWVQKNHKLLGREYNPLELKISVDEKMKTVYRYAVENKVTDISIESQPDKTHVYMIIDKEWELFKRVTFTHEETEEVTNWIIVQAGIAQALARQNIIDCPLPTLGDIKTHRARVNKMSSYHGVTINMRLLPNEPTFVNIQTLGYSNFNMTYLDYLTKNRTGLILVTGPTGSGKNTSIFALITSLLKKDRLKVISLEQPVEYLVPGVQQINAVSDQDYVETARALVRQSPDVIYLSEIRDQITMDTALNVSNTGKLVVSTLHLSNAFEVFNRAEDVYGSDVSKKMMSALIGVVNQILLPKACPDCIQSRGIDTLDPAYQKVLADHKYHGLIWDNTGKTKENKVCPTCSGKGYKGVVPIAEHINFDENLKRRLRGASGSGRIEEILIETMKQGNNSLLDDGLRNMNNKKVNISTLINKAVLETGYSSEDDD